MKWKKKTEIKWNNIKIKTFKFSSHSKQQITPFIFVFPYDDFFYSQFWNFYNSSYFSSCRTSEWNLLSDNQDHRVLCRWNIYIDNTLRLIYNIHDWRKSGACWMLESQSLWKRSNFSHRSASRNIFHQPFNIKQRL